MGKRTILLSTTLVLGLGVGVSATVLHVPSEYPTIQAGIDVAVDGDTVLVADGTYTGDGNRDLDLGGKAIVVMSENGPQVTTIVCEGSVQDPHRGFHFHSGEDSTSVVKGFTIRDGCAHGVWPDYNGGGILCNVASPTIEGNRITGNVGGVGGGISCLSSSAIIVDNAITENSGCGITCFLSSPIIEGNTIAANTGGGGAGIRCENNSSPTIEGNTITENEAGKGGGIGCWEDSSPTIARNVIAGNTTSSGGGAGIYLHENCSPGIQENTITGNVAMEDESVGGGICGWVDSSPTIEGNTITGNAAGMGGGMGFVDFGSPLIKGNSIAANTASLAGGGIYCGWDTSPTVTGNTFTGNASVYGGGMACFDNSYPTVINTILWGDSAGIGGEIFADDTSWVVVTYTDVEGGWPGEGNIDTDPWFVQQSWGDYRLLWPSACIDSGHPDSLDPDGTRSDMGAHFLDQSKPLVIYVSPQGRTIARGQIGSLLYTIINCHEEPEPCWWIARLIRPGGQPWPGNPLEGPLYLVVKQNAYYQAYRSYTVPLQCQLGIWDFSTKLGLPGNLYDEDGFEFTVVESRGTLSGGAGVR